MCVGSTCNARVRQTSLAVVVGWTTQTCNAPTTKTGKLFSTSKEMMDIAMNVEFETSTKLMEEVFGQSRFHLKRLCRQFCLISSVTKVDLVEGKSQTTCTLQPVTVRTCLQHFTQIHQRIRVGPSFAKKRLPFDTFTLSLFLLSLSL